MYDDEPIMQTPFNTEIVGLDQTTLKLNRWEYNPEKELMEVSIETIHTGSDIVKPTFTFSAKERDKPEGFPVKVVYKDDTNIVVQIKNVPETYRIIGLFVFEHRDKKILESEARERTIEIEGSLDQDDGEEKLKLPKPSEKILIGDYRKIKINSNLILKDAIGYQAENIQREIKEIDKQIKVISDEKIPLQKELVKSLAKEIERINSDLEYQTEEEKQESEIEIRSKQEAIEEAKKEQGELENAVKKLMEKREKLLQKLETVSGSHEKGEEDIEKNTESVNQKSDRKDEVKNEKSKSESEKVEDNKEKNKEKNKSDKSSKEVKENKKSE